MYTSEGGEITTRNRYSPLGNYNDEMKEVLHETKKPPDSSPVQEEKNQRIIYFESYEEFFEKNCVNYWCDLFDECICILFTNKYNFCSGYFPDFISTLPINNDDFKYFYPKDNFKYSFSDGTIDFSYPNYYPQFNKGKYSKQISNVNSKYNNSYFYKM